MTDRRHRQHVSNHVPFSSSLHRLFPRIYPSAFSRRPFSSFNIIRIIFPQLDTSLRSSPPLLFFSFYPSISKYLASYLHPYHGPNPSTLPNLRLNNSARDRSTQRSISLNYSTRKKRSPRSKVINVEKRSLKNPSKPHFSLEYA